MARSPTLFTGTPLGGRIKFWTAALVGVLMILQFINFLMLLQYHMETVTIRTPSKADFSEEEFLKRHEEIQKLSEMKREKQEEQEQEASTTPFSNTTTIAMKDSHFYSGFRNQIMAFTSLVLWALKDGHGQILLESLYEKDTYGSNRLVPFTRLWDVPHWNSHYPNLPRLVDSDPVIHEQWDSERRNFYWADGKVMDKNGNNKADTATKPYVSRKQHHLFNNYARHARGTGPFDTNGKRHPSEILMFQGAMRPHPKIRKIIDGLLATLQTEGGAEVPTNTNQNTPIEYLTLHARIEPDMQRHPVCRDKKVLNLQDILDWTEAKWPDPPFQHIFMPINRQYLEKEGSQETVEYLQNNNKEDKINWIAVENLKVLNKARDKGLWNGRVKVFEFGANALKGTEFADRPSITGSMVNFFIAIGGTIFIGTEISTYSFDILNTRFFRNRMENYKYLPDGLHDWTPPGLESPPGFGC